MEHAGFKARLMMAERLVGDRVHRLPPGSPVPVFPIAALPAAPESWSREAGTYVCPVSADWGLWFDFTMNDPINTAVLPSIKGMNPITGQKINTIDLEQYKDKCPIHGCNLSHERYCEECGYKLPPQNYISTGDLWWDGFRQPDGSVRQFFFSEEEERDVASAVIGKENTVPAFGFAFFKPKNPRVMVKEELTRGGIVLDDCSVGMGGVSPCSAYGSSVYNGTSSSSNSISTNINSSNGTTWSQPMFFSPLHTPDNHKITGEEKTALLKAMVEPIRRSGNYSCDDIKVLSGEEARAKRPELYKETEVKAVSVGAGARIDQELQQDTLDMKDWNEEASAIIRLYFVFQPEFVKMLREGGIKNLEGNKVGFLDGVPVG